MILRYLHTPLDHHLKALRQMAFITGPRQVGKTTLAKSLLPHLVEGQNYFNWDNPHHKRILMTQIFAGKLKLNVQDEPVLVFDEVHKYPRWKNSLKGLFDHYEPHTHWIVTGSAALNVYRRGQDSLLGRHFTYHLAPLSVAEVTGCKNQKKHQSVEGVLHCQFESANSQEQEAFDLLYRFGGFPEPFGRASDSFLSRWRVTRLERLINQDLAATENIRHLPLVENLMYLLPERVGGLLSVNNLRQDLGVHFETVKHWLMLLERLFYGFRITPYSAKLTRMIQKEAKWYLWDWSELKDEGSRFENMIAVYLLKYVYYMTDLGFANLSLHYLRDKEKREVDFLICEDRKPLMAIEAKFSNEKPSSSLIYFSKNIKLKRSIQVVYNPVPNRSYRYEDNKIEVVHAPSFLEQLL